MTEDLRKESPEERRLLLIVDPQIDFITGTLPVPGAVEAMDRLALYLKDSAHRYDTIMVTCDRHPLHHCSFTPFGGPWPAHCIQSSVGAAVWPAVMEQLIPLYLKVVFVYKGDESDREEYSAFRAYKAYQALDLFMRIYKCSQVDICGLAGDVCVKTTLEDALRLYPDLRFNILEEYTASLDGGTYVRSMSERLRRRNDTLQD